MALTSVLDPISFASRLNFFGALCPFNRITQSCASICIPAPPTDKCPVGKTKAHDPFRKPVFSRVLEQLGANLGQIGPTWANLGLTWNQLGPCQAKRPQERPERPPKSRQRPLTTAQEPHLGRFGGNSGPTWAQLGATLGQLQADFGPTSEFCRFRNFKK